MANANISFDDEQNVFHLSNRQISYLIQIEEGGLLSHLYFGKKYKISWFTTLSTSR